MTASKILRRLVQYTPAALRLRAKPGPRCVLATRIGIDVLGRFGLLAAPRLVVCEVANAAFMRWVDDGAPGGAAEQMARGCWFLSNDPVRREGWGTLPGQGPPVSTAWNGHLVIAVRGHLVDLDAQQFARPARGIHLPPALVLPWDAESLTGCEMRGGASLCYRPWPSDAPLKDWRTAPDWNADVRDIVDALAHAVRKGGADGCGGSDE